MWVLREQLAGEAPRSNEARCNLARLDSLLSPHSSDWLKAVPAFGSLKMRLSANEMQSAVALRLGLPMAQAGQTCNKCKDNPPLDLRGHHALTCHSGGDAVIRHNRLRDAVRGFCSRAQMSARLEQGAGGGDKTRPADVLVQCWSLNRPAALDVTVVSPFASNLVNGAGDLGGVFGAVKAAEKRKRITNLAKCRALGWECIPLAVDIYGCWGKSAHMAFSVIADRMAANMNIRRGEAQRTIYGVLNMILMRQAARAVSIRQGGQSAYGGREVRQAAPEFQPPL